VAGIELEESLEKGLDALGVKARDHLVRDLARFLNLLTQWNQAFNLTSIRAPEEMVSRHVLDSISIVRFLRGASILDVGTGAGLPGIPLALIEKNRQFTLLDSVGKKVRFVRHVVAELALTNVTVEQVRVESFQPVAPYDTVVCRAFTSLSRFAEQCGRLVADDGRLMAMKGKRSEEELADIPSQWSPSVTPISVPGLNAARHVVILERS